MEASLGNEVFKRPDGTLGKRHAATMSDTFFAGHRPTVNDNVLFAVKTDKGEKFGYEATVIGITKTGTVKVVLNKSIETQLVTQQIRRT